MVQIPVEISRTIDSYLAALHANNIPVRSAILFGSYARGNFGKWSDIDIALVSDLFKRDLIDDKNIVRKITLSISSMIEVIPFAPDDFTPYNPFVKEILEYGLKLV